MQTRALFRTRFCLLGKVVVDICVRYFEASLTLVADTTVEPPKIVRAMTPRLYIPPVCRVVLQKGLMPSEFAQPRHNVGREIFLLSYIQFINYQCIIIIIICKFNNFSIYKTGQLYTFLFSKSTLIFLILERICINLTSFQSYKIFCLIKIHICIY